MKTKSVLASFLMLCAATAALADSTINPNVPANAGDITSAPLRGNFAAARNDINNLLGVFPSANAPVSPSIGQMWRKTSVTPNLIYQWTGTAWVQVSTFDAINGKITPYFGNNLLAWQQLLTSLGTSGQCIKSTGTTTIPIAQNCVAGGSILGTAPINVNIAGGVATASIANGTSVLNPGTGTLETVLPVQTVTAASKTFATADLFQKTRRSNGGSAMTDTFPASSATGLANGTRIDIANVDATASDTITAGAGTTINGSATYVIPPGRDIWFVYDQSATQWRLDANTGTALLAANIGSTVQAWDADLDCIAAISTTGIIKRTGAGACAAGSAAADLTNGTTGSGAVVLATSPSVSGLTVTGVMTAATINGFTLGGTIAGGGNQINNVIIGASSPLAGSFTTASLANGSSNGLFFNNSGGSADAHMYEGAGGIRVDILGTVNAWELTTNGAASVVADYNVTAANTFTITPNVALAAGVVIGAPTGGNKGPGTINVAGALYANGVALSGAGTVTSVTTAGLATGGPVTSTGTITVTPAAKSDQQTGTSNAVAVTPAHQQDHDSAVKTWVKLGGAGGSNLASYGVASTTRVSTGLYTIVWSTSFASADYSCAISIDAGASANGFAEISSGSQTASQIQIKTINTSGALFDALAVHVHCAGRQ